MILMWNLINVLIEYELLSDFFFNCIKMLMVIIEI